VRVVLDLNVVVSGLLSPRGPSAEVLERWFAGEFEVAVCPRWLTEVEDVLRRPRLVSRFGSDRVDQFLASADRFGWPAADPQIVPEVCRDPDDDYLLALAHDANSAVVTGDDDLLVLALERTVWTVRQFLDLLDRAPETPTTT
jgi:uncharacterized protein